MSKLSRKETAGIAVVLVVFAVILGWTLLRVAHASSSPGITLQEAFAQPPGGALPGRPLDIPGSAPAASPPVTSSASQTGGTVSGTSSVSTPAVPTSPAQVPSDAPVLPNATGIVVHVAGAVKQPGVYHLAVGARNDDAIKQAGGPTKDANMDAINLAARLEDGSQLYLPTRKQHPEGGADAPTNAPDAAPPTASSHGVAKAGSKPGAHAAAKSVASTKGAKGGKSGKLSDPSQGTVNINTAGAEELQRIPGIGPAMAERILDFRKQNGKFTAPEDLLQISGVGEKKFAKMQPFVRVR